MEKFSKVSEVAEALNISPKTVWNWIGQRKITVVRFGRSVRVPDSEVQRLSEEGLTPARHS